MKRRKAIGRIGLIAGGAVIGAGGWEAFQLYKRPNLRFLEEHEEVLDDLAETIIPATGSPGAREAAVGPLILKMVRDCTGRKSRNNFINGFEALMDRAQAHYGKPFGRCSQQERTALLAYFEKEGQPYRGLIGRVQRQVTGDSFFTTLKKYTVLGYCSSKPGANAGMRYDAIPGKYIGSVSLEPGQRSWATQ